MHPGEIYTVTWDGSAFVVTAPGGLVVGAVAGPVLFRPNSRENLFRVESIERTNILATGRVRPLYRGALEVARGARTTDGRVNLVNIVELESYVPGVVVNESPAFFHVEALKSQATAARGYAVANIGRFSGLFGDPFDIVDSTASQVYRGQTSEHPRGNEAAEQTRGLVASYEGRIITAFYSSSFGGYSDNVESTLGGTPQPYLRGHYDGFEPAPDFADPFQFDSFWRFPQVQTFDACERVANRFARYRLDVTAASIRSRLPGRFTQLGGAPFNSATSVLTGLEVTERSPASGRVQAVRVGYTTDGSPGALEVRGWDNLRRVIGAPTASTPVLPGCTGTNIAAGFVLNNPSLVEPYFTGADLAGVIVWGGGWGHNVGLSQYGAHGRGGAGQRFIEILKAVLHGGGRRLISNRGRPRVWQRHADADAAFRGADRTRDARDPPRGPRGPAGWHQREAHPEVQGGGSRSRCRLGERDTVPRARSERHPLQDRRRRGLGNHDRRGGVAGLYTIGGRSFSTSQ